ncbi:MAG: hypothetical protein QG588_1122 [Candidatus Poribacteria bacterium]|nr:hypothetical protein [Candidatus Poribacteria bacterium]
MIKHNQVNITSYAKVDYNPEDITLEWEEMRDVFAIVMQSDPSVLAKIQYWQRIWPIQRVAKGAVVGAGGSGWMADDDPYNGEWKTADVKMTLQGDCAVYTFNPINAIEFPDIKDFDANYRRTLKLRILFDGKRPEIKAIEVYSDSIWKEMEFKIEWGKTFADGDWNGQISVYNGQLMDVQAISENVKIGTDKSLVSDKNKGCIKAKVRFTYNEDINSYDKTIVTIRTKAKSFSFLIDEVVAGEKIFIKDFDVLVTKADDNVDYAKFLRDWELNHDRTLYDKIHELPEQTYSKSWNDMPKKRKRGFMPLGCDGGRQKFAVDQNGDVFYSKNYVSRVKGKDTDRVLWDGNFIRYGFGFPDIEPTERRRLDGYLPMIYAKWESDGISYEQTAFATLLEGDILSGESMQGDAPTVLLVKVIISNSSDTSREISLKLTSKCDVEEKLKAKDGFIFAIHVPPCNGRTDNYEPKRMRYFLDTMSMGSIVSENDELFYKLTLAGHESHSLYFKIPFITLAENEFDTLKKADYESELPRVKKFWEDRVAQGTQITVPNEILTNFYKAHVTHMLITDDREVGSDRYASRVGTFPYGVFPDESVMCISDFDRRGYKKEAEERLELLVHYQGTVGVPGTYTTVEGQYYGAGGYECGGYNKSHGWVLWGLGEHYWYYKDKEWLNRVAPSIVKACDWVINERQSTKKLDSQGNKVIEYGFLPAGSLEDVRDYYYWLATNAPTYWGFKSIARALVDAGHPEGERLLKEAEEYGNDLNAGFRESMILSPVVKLRDGTYVPHFPPRLYRRGRGFGWLRETLEGAIHLIRSEMLEPWSDESTWIMKDYEDNLYISDRYGYSVENFERDWFSLGGFSMQSNLLCHTIPYLWRDEPKHFLRGYFNGFTSAFYPDICACVEHALPTLADNNNVWFKPSDEAQSTFWLRLMFIYECDNELNLGMCIPREWLEDGKSVEIRRAETYFGEMGYRIDSDVKNGKIKMVLDPPTRNAPEKINVRFRHPKEKDIKKVLVNGKEWSDFDPSRELIRLGKVLDKIEIVAYY